MAAVGSQPHLAAQMESFSVHRIIVLICALKVAANWGIEGIMYTKRKKTIGFLPVRPFRILRGILRRTLRGFFTYLQLHLLSPSPSLNYPELSCTQKNYHGPFGNKTGG